MEPFEYFGHMPASVAQEVSGPDMDLDPAVKFTASRESFQSNHAAVIDTARDQETQPLISKASKKVCSYWYHYGFCKKSAEDCKFSHILQPDYHQKLSWMPKHSNKGCQLPLCSRKDGKNTAAPKEDSAQLPAEIEQLQQIQRCQKRKFAPHIDQPIQEKKVKSISYDDENENESADNDHDNDDRNQTGDVTCFFWYHGKCARSADERTNYQCPFKHQLTEATMVRPPPGYVHRTGECRLEWCPGDAVQ